MTFFDKCLLSVIVLLKALVMVHSFNPPLPLEMIGQYNVNIMVVIQDCTAVVTVAVSTGSA